MVAYFAIGVALGAATGIPVGVINVAIVDAALRRGRRRALGLAGGGALADGTHAAIALLGLGPLITAHGSLRAALFALTGLLVGVYGIAALRTRAPAGPRAAHATTAGGAARGVLIGAAMTLFNPAALAAWVAVASTFFADLPPPPAVALALGVALGSWAWFSLLAVLARRWGERLRQRSVMAARVVGVLLCGFAGYALYRAVWLALH